MAKSDTKLGPVTLTLDVPLVEASNGQDIGTKIGPVGLSSDVPSVEASSGQE